MVIKTCSFLFFTCNYLKIFNYMFLYDSYCVFLLSLNNWLLCICLLAYHDLYSSTTFCLHGHWTQIIFLQYIWNLFFKTRQSISLWVFESLIAIKFIIIFYHDNKWLFWMKKLHVRLFVIEFSRIHKRTYS